MDKAPQPADLKSMKRNSLFAALAFLLSFGLYWFTCAPSLYWEDSAAFQLSAFELGIPHNPSFPIYLLITKVVTLLPFGSVAFMANLASGIFTALSAVILFLLISRVATKLRPDFAASRLLALLGSLIYATSYAVWMQSIRAEVYGLNAFFSLALVWLIVEYHFDKIGAQRFAALIGLLLGLGFANHYLLLGVVALPLLAGVAITQKDSLLRARALLTGTLFLILGLAAYLYLPIRESFAPLMNWGDFSSLEAALKSILRLDAQLPLAAVNVSPWPTRFYDTAGYFLGAVGLPLLLLSLLGLIHLFRRRAFLAVVCLSALLTPILTASWAAEFSRYNLDLLGYMMISFAGCALLSVVGLIYLKELLDALFLKAEYQPRIAVSALIFMMPLFILIYQSTGSFADANRRDFTATDDYAIELLTSLPENAIFLAGEDNSFLPLLYLQGVEKERSDLRVFSGGALLRADYRHKVKLRNPNLWYPDDWENSSFSNDFERRLRQWCRHNMELRPVCLTLSEWTASMIPLLEPVGFAYRLREDQSLISAAIPGANAVYRSYTNLWEKSNDLITHEHFGRHLFNYSVYLLKHGFGEQAAEFSARAALADPENPALLSNCLNLMFSTGHQQEAETLVNAIYNGERPVLPESWQLASESK